MIKGYTEERQSKTECKKDRVYDKGGGRSYPHHGTVNKTFLRNILLRVLCHFDICIQMFSAVSQTAMSSAFRSIDFQYISASESWSVRTGQIIVVRGSRAAARARPYITSLHQSLFRERNSSFLPNHSHLYLSRIGHLFLYFG